MKIRNELITYPDAASFLERTRDAMLANESANNLILGISVRLERHPERIRIPPLLAAVEDEDHKLVLAAVMTPPRKLMLCSFGETHLGACRKLAQGMLNLGWKVPGVTGEAGAAKGFAQVWGKLSGRKVHPGMCERVYELREVIEPPPVPGRLRQATTVDQERVADWLWAFQREAIGGDETESEIRETARTKVLDGDIYLWEDGQTVAMAGRNRPVVHSISVGPVYTPPAQRGKGYASNLVAGLSSALLAQGWQYCNLYTNLANPTSNAIYVNIGYKPVCDFDEYIFD
jgi:uncharacterized protein